MRLITPVLVLLFTILSFNVASASETKFFNGIQGKWSGPGQIVAGKYKGTKFVCTFDGNDLGRKKIGMDIDGSCRVGVFSQPMNADIIKTAGQYVGSFLDGAKGDGMDITGARYTKGRLVAQIKRNNLDGIMVANLNDPNRLNITISVKHNKQLIPVIGMNLKRLTDNTVTGSVN